MDFYVGCPKSNSLTGLVNKQLVASGPAVGVFNPVLSFFGNSYFYLIFILLIKWSACKLPGKAMFNSVFLPDCGIAALPHF